MSVSTGGDDSAAAARSSTHRAASHLSRSGRTTCGADQSSEKHRDTDGPDLRQGGAVKGRAQRVVPWVGPEGWGLRCSRAEVGRDPARLSRDVR